MPDESERLADLIARLRAMPATDRKAILAYMSLDQRYAVEQLLQAKTVEPVTEEAPAAKRYSLFSPVLARMLGEIDEGNQPRHANGPQLTVATCAALSQAADGIRDALEKDANVKSASFGDVLRSLFSPGVKR